MTSIEIGRPSQSDVGEERTKTCPRCAFVANEGVERCPSCSEDLVRVAGGSRIVDGRYAIERQLGSGTVGVVYLARDVGLGRPVAVKIIAQESTWNPDFREAFQREASALASIRNEHIVQVFAFGMDRGSLFYVMEFVRGRALSAIIAEHKAHASRVPTHRALTIMSQLARGLGVAHAAGLVHCDVTPANVLIEDGTGRPVLIDFCLARAHDATALASGAPAYFAPENAVADASVSVTPAVDIYGFGCASFELLTGRPPFVRSSLAELLHAHASEDAPAISSLRRDLAPFDRFFARALARDPAGRFPDCATMLQALELCTDHWRAGATSPITVSKVRRAPTDATIHVLVVDDDPKYRKVVSRAVHITLHGRHVIVDSAESGSAALAKAQQQPPNLVVVDYTIGGAEDLDTVSRLRSMAEGSDAHVLVVTPNVGDAERWRFSVLGVNDFCAKADGLDGLIRCLERIGDAAGWLQPLAERVRSASTDLDERAGVTSTLAGGHSAPPPPLVATEPPRQEAAAAERAAGHQQRAAVHAAQGEYREAVVAYEEALQIDAASFDALVGLGTAYSELRRFAEARGVLEEAARLRPEHVDVLARLGRVCVALREYDKAAEAFARLAVLRPDDADTLHALGLAHHHVRRHAEAVKAFEQVLAIEPGQAAAGYFLVSSLLELNRPDDALAVMRGAAPRETSDAELHVALGARLAKLGRSREAAETYKAALRLGLKRSQARWTLLSRARLLDELGDSEAAVKTYSKLSDLDPTRPYGFSGCASVLTRLGRHREALVQYEQAVALAPSDKDLRVELVTCLLALGDVGRARAEQVALSAVDAKLGAALRERIDRAGAGSN